MLFVRLAIVMTVTGCALPPSKETARAPSPSAPVSEADLEARRADQEAAAVRAQVDAARAGQERASAASKSAPQAATNAPAQSSRPAALAGERAPGRTKGEIEAEREKEQGRTAEREKAERAKQELEAAQEPRPFDPPPPPPFVDPLAEPFDLALARLQQARGAHENAIGRGDPRALIAALEAAAPDAEKDAAQALALSRGLFVLAPERSKALTEKARALAPTSTLTLEAEAEQLHREQRWSEAASKYLEAITKQHRAAVRLRAQRAECLLRAGDAMGALAEWTASNPVAARRDVEEALARVHGRRDRLIERGELRARASAGDVLAVEKLLLMDVAWNKNPANPDYTLSQREFVAEDMPIAEQVLGKDSRRFAELKFYVDGCLGSEPPPPGTVAQDPLANAGPAESGSMGLPPSAVEKSARKLGFMGFGKNSRRYPISSTMAPAIYRLLFQDGDIVPTEWINWFEPEIQQRIRSEEGDVEAAVFLLDLFKWSIERKFDGWDKLPEKRVELETYAWSRYKDRRIAERILERRGAELKPDDPLLAELLAALPDDPVATRFALDAARRAKSLTPELAAARARATLANEDVVGAITAFNELRTVAPAPK